MTDPKITAERSSSLQQLLKYCNYGKEITAQPVQSKIEAIGTPPNTESAEYSPVLTSDEETIYFTYRGVESKGGLQNMLAKPDPDGIFFEDIFKSGKTNGSWQKPMSIGDNNTNSNDAVIAISNDGQQMFIFRADENEHLLTII